MSTYLTRSATTFLLGAALAGSVAFAPASSVAAKADQLKGHFRIDVPAGFGPAAAIKDADKHRAGVQADVHFGLDPASGRIAVVTADHPAVRIASAASGAFVPQGAFGAGWRVFAWGRDAATGAVRLWTPAFDADGTLLAFDPALPCAMTPDNPDIPLAGPFTVAIPDGATPGGNSLPALADALLFASGEEHDWGLRLATPDGVDLGLSRHEHETPQGAFAFAGAVFAYGTRHDKPMLWTPELKGNSTKLESEAFVGCTDVSGLPALGVHPASAPAGSLISLVLPEGFAPAGQLSLLIGGEPASVVRVAGGGLSAGVPLFLDPASDDDGQGDDDTDWDDTDWPEPPAEPVDVVLLANGQPVAAGIGVLRVTPLTPAPGSSDEARAALAQIVDAWKLLGAELVDQPGDQEQWLTALFQTLDELVGGTDRGSLASLLASADPETLALLDAWFAQSGLLGLLEQYAANITAAADALAAGNRALAVARLSRARSLMDAPTAAVGTWDVTPPATTSQLTTSSVSDIQLSLKMQLYETVKLFGEQFINATATSWSQFSAVLTLVGLSHPLVSAIGLVLSVLDFGVNKMLVGMLPAAIDDFSLTLGSTQLERGETTSAVLKIAAVNDPPGIGVQDFVSQALTAMGVSAAAQPRVGQELLARYSDLMGALQGALGTYAGLHPELNLDTTVASIPALRWEATVTSITLVDRLSRTPTVIDGLPGEVDWQASQTECGAGRIFARTVVGKWGDDVLDSNLVDVNVSCVGVTVSPGFVSLPALGTQQFTATVTGATDSSVTWTSSDCCITSDGFYTAAASPDTYTVTVTATSNEDPQRSASATVLVGGQVIVAPASANVAPGNSVTFSATTIGLTPPSVTWSVSGGGSINAQTGVFTAGQSAGAFTVRATSTSVPSVFGEATVRVGLFTHITATLSGHTHSSAMDNAQFGLDLRAFADSSGSITIEVTGTVDYRQDQVDVVCGPEGSQGHPFSTFQGAAQSAFVIDYGVSSLLATRFHGLTTIGSTGGNACDNNFSDPNAIGDFYIPFVLVRDAAGRPIALDFAAATGVDPSDNFLTERWDLTGSVPIESGVASPPATPAPSPSGPPSAPPTPGPTEQPVF